jgi:sec-independent protein translocase protein TatC
MTLGEHFDELRRRLLRAVIAVGIGMALAYFFGGYFFSLIFWPLSAATGGHPPKLYYNHMAEGFTTYFTVALVAGAIIASPYALYQIWSFVAAGLYEKERRAVSRCLAPSIILFLIGVVFFFIVVAPIGIRFFLSFGQENFPTPPSWGVDVMSKYVGGPMSQPAGDAGGFVQPWLTLESYVTFISLMALVFGLAFQMPLVVLFLVKLGVTSVETLSKMRRYVFFAIIVLSAFLTPSADATSMLAMAIPMYGLYELGLLMARRRVKKTTTA